MPVDKVGAVFIALGLGFQLAFISANQHGPFVHRQESVQQQLALWSGAPLPYDDVLASYPQARNRILFPVLLTGVSRVFPVLRPSQWYLVLRILFAMAMEVGVLACLAFLTGDIALALVGTLLLSYCMIFTFIHPWEHAWDFGDAFFTFLFVALTVTPRWSSLHNRMWLVLAVLVATTNRESAAFAGIIWFFVHGWRGRLTIDVPETAFATTLSVVSYAFATALRHWTAPGEAGADQILSTSPLVFLSHQVTLVIRAYESHSPFAWPILYVFALGPVFWLLVRNRLVLDTTLRRLLWATVAIAGVSLLFGNVDELRAFIPVFSLLICVVTLSEGRRGLTAPTDGRTATADV